MDSFVYFGIVYIFETCMNVLVRFLLLLWVACSGNAMFIFRLLVLLYCIVEFVMDIRLFIA